MGVLSNSRLVYSTDSGRMCPACRCPIDQCACSKKVPVAPSDGIVRVSRETQGRKGKGVTVIRGVALDAAALERLGSEPCDVVLTDLQLPPGPDGIELIRQARVRELDVPFIMLTGHGTVWLQSLPFSRLADRILANAPSAGGSATGEGSLLGGIGRMIGGD